jgi:hypothetical protein
MKKLSALLILSLAFVSLTPSLAFAVKPDGTGNSKPPSTSTPELVGYDISYPQCGRRLPSDHYFGVVGVNGGTAANGNPCLAEQLTWAKNAKDGSKQDKVQLYVNTANPGEYIDQVSTWPTSSTAENPFGPCDWTNTTACSWQYGWNRSVAAHNEYFTPAAQAAGISSSATPYVWWLDIEMANTWQSGSGEALKRNVATLEGMAAYYQAKGARVGLYTTATQWNDITGNFVSSGSNLNGLANWRPSGASLSNAISNCNVEPLTAGGYISMTQYVQKNIDHNHSCI